MIAAEFAPWVTPAVIVVIFAWLRLDLGRLINRVDTNLTRHINDVNKHLGERIDDVNTSLGQRIDEVNARMDRMDRRFDRMDERMQGIDDRLRDVEVTLGTLVGKVDILERFIMRRNEPSDDPRPAPAE